MKSTMMGVLLGVFVLTTILVVVHPAFAQNTFKGPYATSSAPYSNTPPTTTPYPSTASTPSTTNTPSTVDTSGNGLSLGPNHNTGETSSYQMYVIVGVIAIIIAASGIGIWAGMRGSGRKKTKALLK
jgi:hypothetical protein